MPRIYGQSVFVGDVSQLVNVATSLSLNIKIHGMLQ